MGEEVRMSEYEGGGSGGDGDEERVSEWEAGLPIADDLTPLSQPLIPMELASAFSISPEPCRTVVDVNRASQKTVSTLRGGAHSQAYSSNYKSFEENNNRSDEPMVVELDETEPYGGGGGGEGSDSRKSRRVDSPEEADSALRIENSSGGGEDPSGRAVKRPRLVWTPQLHKRFVDVVAHLGIKNAVPKTIMQLMNVEGLTRENVASHLQKYRLYLKRMQGLSNEGPSSSDQLFASTPVPQSLHESGGSGPGHRQGHMPVSIPMPYPPGAMMAMPSYMGMSGGYHGFESHPSYNMMQQQKYGSMVSYPPHVAPNEK
ncbi:putative transcription factor MYB-HB-like family [Rosa chinensis]|uniref:Putative transcription factor MYB-HB-like family n=1 Tax=Rosa chinensis TaxID=74649 RepID=A0A2P6QJ37_ROSCH|nr:transcription factor PCL1 [Rosa chinensis]XP_024157106.1 transcription factor PCL1 [Rosa chinensis]XP_024157107.1 transcription factor PCL1 [Rosa chinensis]XP_040362310.1 transcription factor PCL1 [Rosa chinensis]PRQ34190.1 putative transcription factor MYB-HB-like family [Rosa chinensis]